MTDAWRIAASLVTARSLEEQLNLLLEEAPRVGGGDTATAYLLDEPTGTLRVIALYGYTAVRDGKLRPRGMTRHVLETGETLVVDDTMTDQRVSPVVREAGIRSVVALPIVARRTGPAEGPPERVGVLFVNARHPQAFGPDAVLALQGPAGVAGVAIENTLLHEAQRATTARLEDALRLREQFVSLASHELKSPLTPLKGYAQAIIRRLDRLQDQNALLGQEDVKQQIDETWLRRALGIMVTQIDRVDRLVTDLLDVSRVRTGHFTIDPQPLDLVAFAGEIFNRFRDTITTEASTEAAAGGGHTFLWSPGAETLPGAWDSDRLDQLITNLLSNAVKYSPGGGEVELRVEPAAVPVTTSASAPAADATGAADESVLRRYTQRAPDLGPGWVHLSVRDRGIGLPGGDPGGVLTGEHAQSIDTTDPAGSTDHAGLFEAFTRGENAAKSQTTGFGLGLFICAEIARRHGGAIWAESPGPNQGATFHVLLPSSPLSSP